MHRNMPHDAPSQGMEESLSMRLKRHARVACRAVRDALTLYYPVSTLSNKFLPRLPHEPGAEPVRLQPVNPAFHVVPIQSPGWRQACRAAMANATHPKECVMQRRRFLNSAA